MDGRKKVLIGVPQKANADSLKDAPWVRATWKASAYTNSNNSNSNSTFIALNLRQKTDSKAHHTKTYCYMWEEMVSQERRHKKQHKTKIGPIYPTKWLSTSEGNV